MKIPFKLAVDHWCPSVKSILSDALRAKEISEYLSSPTCTDDHKLRSLLEKEMNDLLYPDSVVRSCIDAARKMGDE